MPFLNIHELDRNMIGLQYPEVPVLDKPRCANLELDWLRCANGLGWKRAKVECKPELDDFRECCQGSKKVCFTLSFSTTIRLTLTPSVTLVAELVSLAIIASSFGSDVKP